MNKPDIQHVFNPHLCTEWKWKNGQNTLAAKIVTSPKKGFMLQPQSRQNTTCFALNILKTKVSKQNRNRTYS